MWYPRTENFPYNSRRTGKTGNSERQVSAMQDQGHGQKSRNQAPDPRTEPQAGRMQNKKKDQPQDKEGKDPAVLSTAEGRSAASALR